MAIHKFRVAGPAHIRDDETGQDVPPGQIVALDDEVPGRNIDALVQGGHVQPIKPKPDKKPE